MNIAPLRVMVDVAGESLTRHEVERLRHPSVAALILFARNFASRAQLLALVAEIRTVRSDLLIAVDHEGGRVQRFRNDGFTPLPAMARIGERYLAAAREPGADVLAEAHAVGYVMAREIRSCGIDFSFAPVLDLDFGRSGVIGDRAFSNDPTVVAVLARALMHGMLQGGMANCGKHFPGHGFALADSHVAMPEDERELAEIVRQDIVPYIGLAQVLASVMPAHVIYPAVDLRPAGFSSVWLKTILRERVGFEGAILSDDLCMQGAFVAGDINARAHAALGAGCDMVLVCNQPEQADELLARLDFEESALSRQRLKRLRGTSPAVATEPHDDAIYRACRALVEKHYS